MDISFVARKFQRSIAGLGLATVLASSLLTGTAFAMTFDDVDSDYFAYDQIDALSDEGIMTGDGATGLFLPANNLSREQAAKILVEAFLGGVDESAEVTCTGDVSSWAQGYMATANLLGVIEGEGDGSCNAAGNMNRASFAAAVVRAANLSGSGFLASEMFTDISADAWYNDDMGILYENGVMSGYAGTTLMGPGDPVTRGQAAKMVYNAMNPVYTPVNGEEPGEPTTSDADLTVEVSNESPDSVTIPNEATGVTVAAWDFTADGDDATVEALTVRQYAVATLPADHEVYLYNGSERLTSGVSVNSTTNEVVFNNVDQMVEDGETVTLSLRLNVGDVGTSTTQVGFEIQDVDMVETDAMSVEGDFPARADEHGISTTSVSEVSIEKNGSITNPNVGDKDVVIAKFTVNAGTNSAALQELGLYASGSIATTEIENFNLYRSGEDVALATVDMVDDQDVVRFVLDEDYSDDADMCGSTEGYCLENGSSRNFEVRADLNTGRSDDTLKFYIDENVDVFAVDADYGFGAKVTSTAYDGDSCTTSSGDCSYSTLQGGDITMTRHNIENTNAAVNQDGVMIMNFTISTETDATFNNFLLKLVADETVAGSGLLTAADVSNFTDIRVKALDGSHTWGPIDADQLKTTAGGSTVITDAADTTGYYLFTDDLALDAGDSVEFGVYVDVENQTALNNDGITASVYIDSTYPEIKDSNNKVLTNTDSLVPTSTFSGDEFTIKSNSLTVALYSGIGSGTEVIGTEDAVLGAFSLTAGDANDIDLTKLTATGYFDTDSSGSFTAGTTFSSIVTNLALYAESVDSGSLLDEAGADSAGLIEFSNADYTIPAGTTVVFYVTGDIANNSSYNDYRVKVDIADVSADVEATDESGDSVSAASTDASNGGTADSGTRITVSSGGTLALDIPSSTRNSQIIVAGTDDNEMSQLKFTATRENFKVYKIALKNDYSATVGDYDDNIATVRVNYFTDEEQTEEASVTCSSSATSGVYTCNFPTTAPLMVPDSDLSGVPDYALATVEVDVNTTASDLADEGDKPNLTFSLTYDFEARGVESNKLIEEAGSNDVSITDVTTNIFAGSVTNYTSPDIDLVAGYSASATSIVVDNGGADAGDANLVGAFLCFDNVTVDGLCTSTEEQAYVTAVADGTPTANEDTLTIVRGVNGTTGAALLDNAVVLVVLPSSAMATNYMQVQATDLDMTIASSSRSGGQSTTESIMTVTATANDAKVVKLRTGLGNGDTGYGEENAAPTALTAGPSSVTRVSSAPTPIEGTYAVKILDATSLASGDGGSIAMGSTGLLRTAANTGGFEYASVWIYINDASSNDSLTGAQINLGTGTVGTAFDQVSAIGSSTAITEGAWVFFSGIAMPTGTDGDDDFAGIRLGAAMTDAGDYVAFDDLRFYNESLNVDLALNEPWLSATPTVAYLQQNGTTVATGYVDFDGATSSQTGQIFFVPVGTYGDIEISGADTVAVQMNTTAAINNNSDATEQLTARIDLGNVSTAGDVRWYDGEDILTFLGVNATDKVEVVSSY